MLSKTNGLGVGIIWKLIFNLSLRFDLNNQCLSDRWILFFNLFIQFFPSSSLLSPLLQAHSFSFFLNGVDSACLPLLRYRTKIKYALIFTCSCLDQCVSKRSISFFKFDYNFLLSYLFSPLLQAHSFSFILNVADSACFPLHTKPHQNQTQQQARLSSCS